MLTIKASELSELNGCEDQVREFKERFGDEVTFASEDELVAAAVAVVDVFYWDWASYKLLPSSARAAYRAAVASASDTFDDAMASASDAYRAARELARAAPSRAASAAIMSSACAAYNAVRDPSRAAYNVVKAPAFARALWRSRVETGSKV